MTPEIERLRAEYQAADDAALEAKRNAADALRALNAAVKAEAERDLVARGIEIGVTAVFAKPEYEWQPEIGPRIVTGVGSRDGNPVYNVAKIKKDGTASLAGNGVWGHIVSIRPWVAE